MTKQRRDVDFSGVGFLLQKSPRSRKDRQAKAKVTFQIRPDIANLIKQVADREDASQSGIVDLFLEIGLHLYVDGRLRNLIDARKTPSRSPRFQWLINADGSDLELESEG